MIDSSLPNQPLDAVVIGGGPAGATAGTLLAQMGRRVCILERSPTSRFHIGESLVPATYHTFKRLGVLDRLKNSSFPKKYSVQFVTHDGKETRPFYFFETNPHESAVTWQVWRASFDRMLLENAQSSGCGVLSDAHVTDVLFDGDRAVGVKVRRGENSPVDVLANVVVDASGQSSMIAHRLKLRTPIPHLRQASVWTYFLDAWRGVGVDAGATIIFSTKEKRGWFWFIPLPGGVTSVGVVSTLDYLVGSNRPPETIFHEQLGECPRLAERLRGAKRVKPFRLTKDFSYTSTRCSGDGWVLVGDALGFLDPVYSTGVILALKSAELAADAIDDALHAQDTSGARLGSWGPVHQRALDSFRRLVYAFYSYEFSIGQFIRAHPQYYTNLVDLLVGDAYKEGVDEIFTVMGDRIPYDGHPPTADDGSRLIHEMVS